MVRGAWCVVRSGNNVLSSFTIGKTKIDFAESIFKIMIFLVIVHIFFYLSAIFQNSS